MNLYRKNAIIVGILFIAAIVVPIISKLFTLHIDAPDYLIKVSTNANQVTTGALLELIFAFACAGIAIWLYPVLKKQNEALALGSVGARLVEGVFHIVAVVGLLSLVT